jgi:3D (Asp-Asp-Asp) domain-containing protein
MPGEIELTRIGFSYAGVVGACNVELEPWRHVAVSRDLLAEYPCGTEVMVTLPEPVGGREGGIFIVGDTMNPIHERTVNIYVAEDEPAFEYGLLEGGVFSASP